MSFLLAVTLVWGGCLSCSQYFMFPGAKAPCCNPAGHCRRMPAQNSAPKDCTIQSIELPTALPDASAHFSLPVAGVALALAVQNPASDTNARPLPTFPPKESPLDLCLRNSVFRV
jgi:hypothetical protein